MSICFEVSFIPGSKEVGRKQSADCIPFNRSITRTSAISDKPHDAFGCQSRSPNMLPFHTIGMVSY